MHTPDMAQNNIARIRELFPNCVTEAKNRDGNISLAVDFDALRQELSDSIVEGERERYRLDWPGKKEAMLAANAPIAKTLRPCREESVDFDTTQNLFIEGDNLDALKLLQESYLGKVKMIYIDPPYNTGNDFIYNDDFAETAGEYLARSNQKNENGRLVANTESNGRFHSDWLSMMYPRLKLARNLLADDGVIFISCDDNELCNINKLCQDVFGSNNFISNLVVISNPRGRQSDTHIASVHDYIIVYCKNINIVKLNGAKLTDEQRCEFLFTDITGEQYRLLGLRQRGSASKRKDRPDMFFPIYVSPDTKKISIKKIDGWYEVLPKKSDNSDGRWMWGKEKCQNDMDKLVARYINRRNEYDIFVKDYLNKNGEERQRKQKSLFDSKNYNNQNGTQEVKEIFDNISVMSFPKPKELIFDICNMGSSNDALILDFFAGSSTTAHAVMQLNAEDGGNRRFIMVQLPEVCDEKSEAAKAGYKTIAEISKERIRRAGTKIREELAAKQPDTASGQGNLLEDTSASVQKLDTGFRVLKVDSSNMADVFYNPDTVSQKTLMDDVSSIKYDRSPEDLLFQVLLDWGVDLSMPIRRETIQGKTVFFVDENALVACFDKNITEELVHELAEFQPVRAVFRDDGFVSDAVKINVDQIFRQISPGTLIKSL